jgi:class 3 adenylate cyclase
MSRMATCVACGSDLPPEARFCPACGAPVEEAPPSEERKVATVLFGDLVGSTQLAHEQDDPERTRALLDRFYDAMAGEVRSAGGTLEKFAGDAVMAVFGAPAAQEDHAERALHAALSMQRRLREVFGEQLALRIGVNTGEVVVGRAREGSSLVTGDAVNVAARLEQTAAAGEILAGERTVSIARGAFEFDEPATFEAKGKPGGVTACRLVRALTLMRPRGVGGLRRAFVGRDSELELLQVTYRRAVERREPHFVTVMGETGVGKTRLVRELWEWLANESPKPFRRTGRCLPYGQGITYWPLGEVLKEHLGILETDPPETALPRLEPREILGLTLGLDVTGDLHPLTARDRLHDAWVDFLDELTAAQPAVVLIEDLHWAEDDLLDLLERLLREVQGPLLLLSTARPELLDCRPTWGGGRRNASLLWLEPLGPGDAERMVDELLAVDLPPGLREVVVERAEGNPFFVEELIATLIDQGVLERRDGGWSVHELPAAFAVPDSVQAVVAARIDLLPAAQKAALQAASVIGRIFWGGPVCELVAPLEPEFGMLEERDFIRRRPGSSIAGEREFAIKHALTREVAHGSLPKARRARLHAEFAGWLERTAGLGGEPVPLLAHHYAEAVRPEDADLAWAGDDAELERLRQKAVAWLTRAGDLAIARYEIDDAIGLFRRGVELARDDGTRAELWRKIGHANALKFDGEAFWTAMQRSLELSTDRLTRAETFSELAFHTAGRSGMWKRLPERRVVDEWIEHALELSEPGSAARARALIAQCYWSRDKSMAFARDASAIAEALGDPELRSYAWDARAVAAFAEGHVNEALGWSQRRLELVDEINDPDHLADIQAAMVPMSLTCGRFREGRRLARAHDEVAGTLSPHHRVHGVAVLLEVEEVAGEWESIRKLSARTREAVRENLATPCVRNARSLLVCALASASLGDREAAEQWEAEADELGMEGYEAILNTPRIRLRLIENDLGRVEELLGPDYDLGRETGFFPAAAAARLDALAALGDRERLEAEAPPLLKAGAYLEPFALRALGRVREDEALIRQAVERFEAMWLGWHAAQTRALLG